MISGKGILPWHHYETGQDGRSIVLPANVTLREGLKIIGLDKESVTSERVISLVLADGRTIAAPALWDQEAESESTTYTIIRNDEAIAFVSERYRPLTTLSLLEPSL